MTVSEQIRLVLFIVITVAITVLSRRTLLHFHSHGFYRFIAWEAIAALILWNLPRWFSEPLSPRQIVSWIILFGSLYVLWSGVSRFRAARRSGNRTESDLFAFERTSELVTTGIYRYIRHPLYASLLYLAWGAYLKEPGWTSTVLAVIASASLVATAKADEKECVQYFGDQYTDYMRRTRMFIPLIF